MRPFIAALAAGTLSFAPVFAQTPAPSPSEQPKMQHPGSSVNTAPPPKPSLSAPAQMPSAAGSGGALDTTTQKSGQSVSANVFVERAQMSNAFELESSQLAAKKATSERIREFAQMVQKEHTQASNFMQQALSKTNAVGLGGQTTVTQLDGPHRQLLADLQRAEGADFDRLYVAMQTKAHEEAVQLYSTYATTGDDPALKQFAQSMLPVLQKHLQQVKALSVPT